MSDAKLCKYECGRPAAKWKAKCGACDRIRCRTGPCPTCDGPRYGPDRWCPRCGPYKVERAPERDEALVVLIAPDGREREVIRRWRENVPAHRPRQVSAADLGGVIVSDVTMTKWRIARLGFRARRVASPSPTTFPQNRSA